MRTKKNRRKSAGRRAKMKRRVKRKKRAQPNGHRHKTWH